MEESSEDFDRPEVPEWDAFEDAAVKLYHDWEITQHAVEDEWAGGLTEDYAERVLDHLLANFAERWLQGRGTKMDAVAEFLTDSINDHFEVEIPHTIALPLARVLVTLHDECRQGNLTGVTHVLGRERVEQIMARPTDRRDDTDTTKLEGLSLQSAEKTEDKKPQAEAPKEGEMATAASAMDPTPANNTDKPLSVAEAGEDDGWTTVSKKKGKKKGKQFD